MNKPSKPKRQHELSDEWTPCTEALVSDVIRWTEPIWSAIKKKRGKPDSVGIQRVTAEVEISSEFLQLYVLEIGKVMPDGSLLERELSVKVEDSIRRRIASILEQGNCERLKWKDEGARKFYLESRKPE